jgi:hypothetical protein
MDIKGVYSAIANAVQTIHTTRFLPPDVIVMHPRRWGWFLSLLDQQQRPLFLPVDNAPMNTAGILTDVDSQQVVGRMHGLPIVTDPNLHFAGVFVHQLHRCPFPAERLPNLGPRSTDVLRRCLPHGNKKSGRAAARRGNRSVHRTR